MNATTGMLKKVFSLSILFILFSFFVSAQATFVVTDPQKDFKDAKELFVKEQYALAYPLFKELKKQYPDDKKSDHLYLNDDIDYYYIVCGLKLQLPIAEEDAKLYIDWVNNEPRRELMSYHLAKYYFTNDDYKNAIEYYERAGIDNLSNEQILDAKFERAYCYFNLKRFEDALPLFNEIRQFKENKYYMPANYYYGFICFYNQQYDDAYTAFKVVEFENDYKSIVPYYLAEILYLQGKKEDAMLYAREALDRGGLYYEKEMKQLLGQLLYEKGDFKSALPYLEYYVNNSDKVSQEDLYEVSYCYYKDNQLNKAIDGFKQLSNQQDSLGQNSMYLLADCYLRTNQKENARTAFQYCANNNSNLTQQEISKFNYAKLSYELGYQDVALNEMRRFINDYPNSDYQTEAKEILINLLANTNNFNDALTLYKSFGTPTASMQKVYPRILYGRAVEYVNDQQLSDADELFSEILTLPQSNVTPYANFWKGEIDYRLTKYDDAIRYLNQYLQSNAPAQGEANYTTAKYDIGYCWMQKENYRQALAYFEPIGKPLSTATSLQQDAYVRTADCYYMNKDFAKANTMYDYVINNALPQNN